MIGAEQFKVMKRGMRIVNCARGGIVDEYALVDAVNEGIVAGAGFDVFEERTCGTDHPFLGHPRSSSLRHLGASTVEPRKMLPSTVSEQVLHILRNEPFMNAVNMPPVPAAVMAQAVSHT